MAKKKDRRGNRATRSRKGNATSEAAEERRARRKETKKAESSNSAVEWAKSGAIAVLLFIVMRTFFVQTFVITSGSMKETLLVGDMLLVNRMAIGSRVPGTDLRIPGYSTPEWGDILVFDPPHEDDLMLIKRLIGMPGDTLEMRDRVLIRNGEAVDEPYTEHIDGAPDDMHPWMQWQREHLVSTVDPAVYAPTRDNWGPLVVPEGNYFMLGDNREESFDSRYWGLLEAWRLEGRAVFTYYSYNKDSFRPFPAIREVRWGRIGRGIS